MGIKINIGEGKSRKAASEIEKLLKSLDGNPGKDMQDVVLSLFIKNRYKLENALKKGKVIYLTESSSWQKRIIFGDLVIEIFKYDYREWFTKHFTYNLNIYIEKNINPMVYQHTSVINRRFNKWDNNFEYNELDWLFKFCSHLNQKKIEAQEKKNLEIKSKKEKKLYVEIKKQFDKL